MAMPTRKPLKLLAMAITNNARPYTIDAIKDEDLPPARPIGSLSADERGGDETADWASVPRKICWGTSVLAVPILSSR